MKTLRMFIVLAVALAALALGARGTDAALGVKNCSGGDIDPGTYLAIRVTGFCTIPEGTVSVTGNITVAPGGVLNAGTPATVQVRGSILVFNGGSLILGCNFEVDEELCANPPADTVQGNIFALSPYAVIIHAISVQGNILIQGGSEDATCPEFDGLSIQQVPFFPAYVTIEDSQINGNVAIYSYTGCWLGFIRNDVHGNVTIANNHLGDPDANEVVTNEITGNLICINNDPKAQIGDSGGSANEVSGNTIGECANLEVLE